MANTKISALPSYTGTEIDSRWFVMNNSGETETFKYSGYSSPFRASTGTNSVVANNIPTSATSEGYNFIFGSGNTALDLFDIAFGGRDNIVRNALTNNGYNTVLNGINNKCGWTGAAQRNTNSSFITASINSTLQNNGSYSSIIGCNNCTSDGNSSYQAYYHSLNSSMDAAANSGIILSNASSIAGGEHNGIYNSKSSSWAGYISSYLTIIGSDTVAGNGNLERGSYKFVGGAKSSTIRGTGQFHTLISANNSWIASTGSYIAHIATSGSTTSGSTQGAVMLGTINRNATLDFTTYVENFHSYRPAATQTQVQQAGPVFTGTNAVNLALGGKPRVLITGNADIETIGVRDGQSFVIHAENDGLGPYTINWTNNDLSVYNTPYNYRFAGGNSGTGAGTHDLFRCEVFEDVIYVERIEDFQ